MADAAEGICSIRDIYTQSLSDLHDDFVQIKMLWRNLQVRVQHGLENPKVSNPVTGSVVQGDELAAMADPSLDRLRNRSFKDIIAQLELFTAELLRIWLFAHPLLMSEKALTLETLLNCNSLADAQAAAILEAVDSTVIDKMFGRPEKWFNYLRKNLGAQFSIQDVLTYAEMKARRDALEHHGGIVEATYQEKAKEAGKYKFGELIQLTDDDVDAAYQLVLTLVRKIADDAMIKLAAA